MIPDEASPRDRETQAVWPATEPDPRSQNNRIHDLKSTGGFSEAAGPGAASGTTSRSCFKSCHLGKGGKLSLPSRNFLKPQILLG